MPDSSLPLGWRFARHLATVAGAVCLLLFVLINVSDWPGGFLNQFWLDHAIVGATAGSLLLGATVFLVYRYRDQQRQDELDESIVDAARSELVDRLVDLDVGLSLLCSETVPELCQKAQWRKSVRGLEWLRQHLDEAVAADDAFWMERDPRLCALASQVQREDWRLPLLDQMIKHVAAGVRDWGPILMKSRQGQRDLVAFANVRLVLIHLDRELRLDAPMDTRAARRLQGVLRSFAHLLEVDGVTPEPRARLILPPSSTLLVEAGALEDEKVQTLIGQIQDHVRSRTWTGRRRSSPGARGERRGGAVDLATG